MTSSKDKHIVYAPITLDFVKISVEFCTFLEKMEVVSREEWIKVSCVSSATLCESYLVAKN